MFVDLGWIMPASNQMFRLATIRQLERTTGTRVTVDLARGPNESSIVELRRMARDLRNIGAPARAGQLFVAYYTRWALPAAALLFALFALGIASHQPGRVASIICGIAMPAVYLTYLWELAEVHSEALGSEWAAMLFAWMPNIALLVVSLLLMHATYSGTEPLTPSRNDPR
jgi:lipopolysaccharide export LptBFGC system permease protein LptF